MVENVRLQQLLFEAAAAEHQVLEMDRRISVLLMWTASTTSRDHQLLVNDAASQCHRPVVGRPSVYAADVNTA